MDKQSISLFDTALSHRTPVQEAWSGDAAAHQYDLELQPVRYSAKAIQHGHHPAHARRMEHPDAYASKVGWCGEMMEM